jgi:ubiquinone/menaquinone biosynthesis C-methylase UbiE
MTVVRTLDELDAMMATLDVAAAESDDALRRAFERFRMDLDLQLPDDPYSDEYRRSVFSLYEWLHGAPYSTSNEIMPIDVERTADVPFPYRTQSAPTVGNYLIAIGHVIRTLDLPPGSKVLEFGAGWGTTTIALARMGYDVTAVDIGPSFVDVISTRAARVHAAVKTVVGDFSVVHELEDQFDAVLFFESFHHCSDHLSLLSGLDRVVAKRGRVLFAAEPIAAGYPVPWGLRLDGESLWAIRKNGWFELGYDEEYFVQTLRRFGWQVEKVHCSATPWGLIYVATRVDDT